MPTAQLDENVASYLDTIEDPNKRSDADQIIAMIGKHTGEPAALWRGNVIGFGRIKYRYPTGTTGETFITGFAPRKTKITLYTLWYQSDDDPFLAKLGKYKRGKGCLYINRLSDVDIDVLDLIIHRSATDLSGRFIIEN